jgi:hypothetical protein
MTKLMNASVSITDNPRQYSARATGINAYSTRYTFGVNPAQKWVIGGEGNAHTMAISADGIVWQGMGKNTFSTRCNDVVWNGYVWVAVGSGGNTMCYSRDGTEWVACVNSFGTEGRMTRWNGTMFVSVGTDAFGYSYDGIGWTDISNASASFFGNASFQTNVVEWNGLYWLIGGDGSGNRVLRSMDGKTWSGLDGTGTFTASCNALVWTGDMWIGGGSTTSNTGVLASSYNNGETWTTTTTPIDISVSGLATNGKVFVAVGMGNTHTIAYSYDGMNWTGLGRGIFTNTTTNASVKWFSNKFIAFSSGTNTLAYSYDGIRWLRLTNSLGIFSQAGYGGDCATKMPHSVVFPSNMLFMGNLVSLDTGASWAPTMANTQADVMGWNGRHYIMASQDGNARITADPLSANYVSLQWKNDPALVHEIQWNGEYWLLGGTSGTAARRQLMKSYDGYTWLETNTQSYFAANYPCKGIEWNGTMWVVSGKTAADTPTMIYSYDGETWAQSTTSHGGGKVKWNGAYFLCGGLSDMGGNTRISTSADGVQWSTKTIGVYGEVETILWNGAAWVLGANRTDGSGVLLTSSDGTNWIADSVYASTYRGGTWTGSCFVVNTGTNAVRTSYDGKTWTTIAISHPTGRDVLYSSPEKGCADIQQPTIIGGVGDQHSMAISADGILYRGLGKTIFSLSCNAVDWNGRLWVAGGAGTNTLAYSYDGVRWNGLGSGIFSEGCYAVSHNNNVWIAMGSGGNTMATSSDGIAWTGLGTPVFDASGLSADWNGRIWLVGGKGATNTIAYTSNASATGGWTGLGNATFSAQCASVRWMANKWVALGSGGNTIAYTETAGAATGWTGLGNAVFTTKGTSAFWNGDTIVALGSGGNTIATSSNGIAWTGLGTGVFSTSGGDVVWNTKRWIATGSGGNTIAYSYNGSEWFGSPDTAAFFTQGVGIATNSRIGASANNSGLRLNASDRFALNTPASYDVGLAPDTTFSFQMSL